MPFAEVSRDPQLPPGSNAFSPAHAQQFPWRILFLDSALKKGLPGLAQLVLSGKACSCQLSHLGGLIPCASRSRGLWDETSPGCSKPQPRQQHRSSAPSLAMLRDDAEELTVTLHLTSSITLEQDINVPCNFSFEQQATR